MNTSIRTIIERYLHPKRPQNTHSGQRFKALRFVASYAIFVNAWLTVSLFIGNRISVAQPNESEKARPAWLVGDELEQKLRSAVSITLTSVPLREELFKVSRHEGIGLFIDRRVDPMKLISFNEANLTFEQLLWKLAAKNELGVCQLGEIYYLGPADIAQRLPLVWYELKAETNKLKRRSKVKWEAREPVRWPILNEPAQTLNALAKKYQFKIRPKAPSVEGAQATAAAVAVSQVSGSAIPHDVWPEIQLPDLPVDEQVALLLVGFGLWFERSDDGAEIQIIDFPSIDRGQIAWNGTDDLRKSLSTLKRQLPEVSFSMRGKTLIAKGSLNDLVTLTDWLVSQREAERGAVQTYSLKTHATRQQILTTVCQRINRNLEFAPDLARIMDERIELSVDKVDLDEVVRQSLAGSDLKFRWLKDTLIVER